MVALSVVFAVFVMVFRPFARAIYNVYQVLNELTLVFFLTTLLYLDYQRDHGSVDYEQGVASGFVLIAFWLLVPALGILFGIVGFAMRMSGYSTQTTLIPAKSEVTQPNELVLMPKTSQEGPEVSQGEGNFTANNSNHETYIRSPNANAVTLNMGFDKEQPKSNRAKADQSRSVLTIPCPVYEDSERRRQTFFTGAMREEDRRQAMEYNSQMRSPRYDNSQVYDPAESDFEYRGGERFGQKLSNSKFSSHRNYEEDGEASPRVSRRSRAASLNLEQLSNFRKRPVSVERNDMGAQREISVGGAYRKNRNDQSRSPRNRDDFNNSRRKKFMTAYQLKTKFLEDEGFKMFKERFGFDDDQDS